MEDARKRVYTWEFPVRFSHWINVLCIITLSVSGYYIGNPFIHAASSKQYIMGWFRLIHFISAYVLLMSIIIRIYWSLVGNRYAHITEWLPFSGSKIQNLIDEIKCYLFISNKLPGTAGHRALAGTAYIVLYAMFLFQIFSGFALYSLTHTGALWTALGGWLLGVMHLQTIRLFHHLFLYVFIAYGLLHIYALWFSELRDKSGQITSMFSGYKYIEKS